MTACDATDYPYETAASPQPCDLRRYWDVAIGLQETDGLKPSRYLKSLADENVSGKISLLESGNLIRRYYKLRDEQGKQSLESEREADLVSQRIAELLARAPFAPVPEMLQSIHRSLFQDLDASVYHPGEYKTDMFVKRESILNGDSVIYGAPEFIAPMLESIFSKEEGFDYGIAFDATKIEHFASFASRIWQVHPFFEGNTRTVAVFVELYLRDLGFDVANGPFEQYSRYFRDALVRANYRNAKAGIASDKSYLVRFFENLLCGAENSLQSRDLVCEALFINPTLLRNMPAQAE